MNLSKNYVESVCGAMDRKSRPLMYQLLDRRGFEAPVTTTKLTASRPMGKCYRNAHQLTGRYPELIYCEGLATDHSLGLPIEHGWCLTPEGEILDPTWSAPCDYYGVAFRHRPLCEILLTTEHYGVFGNLMAFRKTPTEVFRILLDATYDPRELPV